MAPIAIAGMLSPIGIQLRPASTVRQTPPVAAPRKTSFWLSGLTARTEARPAATFPYGVGEMGAGPMGNQVCPLMTDAERAGVETNARTTASDTRKLRGRRMGGPSIGRVIAPRAGSGSCPAGAATARVQVRCAVITLVPNKATEDLDARTIRSRPSVVNTEFARPRSVDGPRPGDRPPAP